ncbi:unnamed protein product [Alopecurus aequalis]
MAEIDTRPLESVQAALNLFEQRSDHSRFSSPDRIEQEVDVLAKELATCRLQLEVKENENKQANLRLEALNKAMQKQSEKYDDRIAELETDVVLITSRQSQTASECDALRDELDAMKRANAYVLGEVESMETRRILERESARDGLMRVLELNEAVLESAVAAMRAEEERSVFFQEVTLELFSSGRNAEAVRRQKEAMESMEGELLAKTVEVDCLRSELKNLKDLYYVSSEMASKDQVQEPDVALAGTVPDSTACQGDSEVTETYFDSELPMEDCPKVRYDDDDGIYEDINGSMPDHAVEIQEEPTMGVRLAAESPREVFQIVVVNSKDGTPTSLKQVRFLDESFKSLNSDDCKSMNAGIGMPKNLAGKRGTEEPETAGDGFVTEIVVVNSKDANCDDDFYTKEVADTDKPGDGYVLVAKNNGGADGEEALKDEKPDAAHTEISDLRFSLEEAVRRAELAEEAKAALERELKKEIKMKQHQPPSTDGRCRLYPPPTQRRPPAPSQDQRIPAKARAKPTPSCRLTLGKVLNMKYK